MSGRGRRTGDHDLNRAGVAQSDVDPRLAEWIDLIEGQVSVEQRADAAAEHRAARLRAVERGRLTGIFDRAAPLYDTLEPRFFREIARRLVARVSLAPDSDVLDIATGPGVVVSEMARAGEAHGHLVGVDLSAGMVREARARLSSIGVAAHVLVMAAELLAFLDESFDVVTMSRAYLLPQRHTILQEIRRVLRPGGRVAIAEFGRLDQRWAWKNDLYARLLPSMPAQAHPVFDAATLKAGLLAAGFHGVHIESEDLDVSYASLEEWWESSMTHGERGVLELLDGDARQAFFEQARPDLCVELDGRLHWRSEVVYGTAVRPRPAEGTS